MKTVAELNEKWWYRLLKVAYYFCFVTVCFLIVNQIVISTKPFETLDLQQSNLVCLKSDRTLNFKISFEEINRIKDSTSAYKVLYKDWDRDDLIGEICNTKNLNDKPLTQTNTGLGGYTPIGGKNNWRKDVLDLHKIEEVNKVIGSYWITFFLSCIAIIIVLLCFDLVRRSFYYVILGSFVPHKK